jgi:hypothetical protein
MSAVSRSRSRNRRSRRSPVRRYRRRSRILRRNPFRRPRRIRLPRRRRADPRPRPPPGGVCSANGPGYRIGGAPRHRTPAPARLELPGGSTAIPRRAADLDRRPARGRRCPPRERGRLQQRSTCGARPIGCDRSPDPRNALDVARGRDRPWPRVPTRCPGAGGRRRLGAPARRSALCAVGCRERREDPGLVRSRPTGFRGEPPG